MLSQITRYFFFLLVLDFFSFLFYALIDKTVSGFDKTKPDSQNRVSILCHRDTTNRRYRYHCNHMVKKIELKEHLQASQKLEKNFKLRLGWGLVDRDLNKVRNFKKL